MIDKAFCESDTVFNISIGTLVATQCSFIVCLVIYKHNELKRHNRRGDCWCVFIYTYIVISFIYVLALWLHTASLVLNIIVEKYNVEGDYAFYDYAAWSKRDDQIEDTLYYYTPAAVSLLIVLLHTRIAV